MLYSAISCVTSSIAILIFVTLGEAQIKWIPRKHMMAFAWIATLTALDMGATNIAVESISVALQQTIKASLPVMVVILEVLMQVRHAPFPALPPCPNITPITARIPTTPTQAPHTNPPSLHPHT